MKLRSNMTHSYGLELALAFLFGGAAILACALSSGCSEATLNRIDPAAPLSNDNVYMTCPGGGARCLRDGQECSLDGKRCDYAPSSMCETGPCNVGAKKPAADAGP